MTINPKLQSGLTLVEILLVLAIISGIAFMIGSFGINISNLNIILGDSFTAQNEIQQTLTSFSIEVRSMGPSADGSYMIESATSRSFTFFSNIDADQNFERVRYFVSGGTLKKGVIKASGNPAVYLPAGEIVTDMVHNLVAVASPSTSQFWYYDKNYNGSQAAMAVPVNPSAVRLVKFEITSDPSPQNPSARVTSSSTVIIRNLIGAQ